MVQAFSVSLFQPNSVCLTEAKCVPPAMMAGSDGRELLWQGPKLHGLEHV